MKGSERARGSRTRSISGSGIRPRVQRGPSLLAQKNAIGGAGELQVSGATVDRCIAANVARLRYTAIGCGQRNLRRYRCPSIGRFPRTWPGGAFRAPGRHRVSLEEPEEEVEPEDFPQLTSMEDQVKVESASGDRGDVEEDEGETERGDEEAVEPSVDDDERAGEDEEPDASDQSAEVEPDDASDESPEAHTSAEPAGEESDEQAADDADDRPDDESDEDRSGDERASGAG